MVDQLFFRHQAADAREQNLQQPDLARRQFHHLIMDIGNAPDLIERQRPMAHERGTAARAAPHQRTHARFQLGQRERFGHVVVGAQVQALDAFFHAVGGGQNQHRQHGPARAQALEDLQPRHTRQSHVEDQQVIGLGRLRGQRRVGSRPIGGLVDGVARLAQRACEPVRQRGVVFGNQDAHACLPAMPSKISCPSRPLHCFRATTDLETCQNHWFFIQYSEFAVL